ncbi:MAG TPA: LemA family protein [Acidimicrobiia bacterium]|nr:LemA family protein [Acidimicrobiia bacterium]
MRVRSSVIIIVLGVVAVGAASTLSMYPSLSDARDQLESQWGAQVTTLDQRYELLAALSRAVRAVEGDLELLDDVDDALGEWKALTSQRPTPDPDAEPAGANRVEGEGARLARVVTTRPSLQKNADVVLALREYLAADVRATLEPYNGAVKRYDRARNRFPGPFLASLLGFETVDTVEVPGALDDLVVPEPPPEPAPTSTTVPPAEAPPA